MLQREVQSTALWYGNVAREAWSARDGLDLQVKIKVKLCIGSVTLLIDTIEVGFSDVQAIQVGSSVS